LAVSQFGGSARAPRAWFSALAEPLTDVSPENFRG
jgi:hypothetical protein